MVVYDEDDVETTVMLEEKRAKAQAKSTTTATTAADTTAAATAAAPSPTAAKPPSAPDEVGAGEAAVQGPREAGKALESVRAFQKLQEQRVHTYRDFEECVVAPLDVHACEQSVAKSRADPQLACLRSPKHSGFADLLRRGDFGTYQALVAKVTTRFASISKDIKQAEVCVCLLVLTGFGCAGPNTTIDDA